MIRPDWRAVERAKQRATATDAAIAVAGAALVTAEEAWLANVVDVVAYRRYQAADRRYQRTRAARDAAWPSVTHAIDVACRAAMRVRTARCRRPGVRSARSLGSRRRATRTTASTGDPDPEPPRQRRASSSGGAS